MGEGRSHWSSMVLRKSQTCFSDRHTHPNSMYLNFCHVLKITPLFMGSDSLEISLPSIVLDSPIYRKKINRLTVLEEYKDKYADNARTVKPRKNFILPCQFDIKIPENASNGSLKLSFEREGCGRCTPLNDLSIVWTV